MNEKITSVCVHFLTVKRSQILSPKFGSKTRPAVFSSVELQSRLISRTNRRREFVKAISEMNTRRPRKQLREKIRRALSLIPVRHCVERSVEHETVDNANPAICPLCAQGPNVPEIYSPVWPRDLRRQRSILRLAKRNPLNYPPGVSPSVAYVRIPIIR